METGGTYTITFASAMVAIIGLVGSGLGIMVKRWFDAAEKADAEKERARELKDKDIHDAFQVLHVRIDSERDKREALVEKIHGLEISMAALVKREEMQALYDRIDEFQKAVLAAITREGK